MKSLVSICKTFRFVLFPFFRRTAVINLCRPCSYVDAPIPIDHRRMVTSLTVRMGSRLQKWDYDDSINLHFSNLADFSNLVEFHWAQPYHISKEIYLFLRSHSTLRDLKIESEYDVLSESFLGNLNLPPPQCALSMASIENHDIMKDIFRHGSASNRTITHLVIADAYLLQALDAETAFPSLVHIDLRLSFGKLYLPFLFKFLDSNPTLERITIRAWAANPCTRTHAGRIPTLPRLKYFIAEAASHSPFLSLVFGKRTLDTLSLGGLLLNGEEIQRIPWSGLKDFEVSLEDIAAQNALIETLGSSREMAWRKVTIRSARLETWTENLDVSNTPVLDKLSMIQIDSYQVLHKFLTAMANKITHLTHLYIVSLFNFENHANKPDDGEAIRSLQGVAERLDAFPGCVEVMVSSRTGMRFIRFLRRRAGEELPPSFEWIRELGGFRVQIKGWIHQN